MPANETQRWRIGRWIWLLDFDGKTPWEFEKRENAETISQECQPSCVIPGPPFVLPSEPSPQYGKFNWAQEPQPVQENPFRPRPAPDRQVDIERLREAAELALAHSLDENRPLTRDGHIKIADFHTALLAEVRELRAFLEVEEQTISSAAGHIERLNAALAAAQEQNRRLREMLKSCVMESALPHCWTDADIDSALAEE